MKLLAPVLSILLLVCGCSETEPSVELRESTNVNFVCVGMETSARFGECPGCKLDSDRMSSLFKTTFGYSGRLLQSAQATRTAVYSALKDGIASTPDDGLFIFYYSGHGGQELLKGLGTSEPDGADEEDEYICLYDGPILDDEIWALVSSCRGRVFLCFDACHSQTMFRSVASGIALDMGLGIPLGNVKSRGFRLKPRGIPLAENSLRMLCWSGCLEGEYSYGSPRGGELTNAILDNWSRGISYSDLWNRVSETVNRRKRGQHPYSTQYGTGFGEAFR